MPVQNSPTRSNESFKLKGTKILFLPALVLLLIFIVTCGKKAPPIPPTPIVAQEPMESKVSQTGDLLIFSFRLPALDTDNKSTQITRIRIFRLKDQRVVLAQPSAPQTAPQTQTQTQTQPQSQPQTQTQPQTQMQPQTQTQAAVSQPPPQEQPRSIAEPEFKDRSEEIADIPEEGIDAYIRDGYFLFTEKLNPTADSEDFQNWFHYAVKLYNKKGKSGPVSKSAATYPALVPKAPSNFVALISEKKITLSWAPVTTDMAGNFAGDRPVTYNVYRGTSADMAPVAPLNSSALNETSYEDTTIQFGQSYYYFVRAQFSTNRKEQESSASNAVLVFPQDIYPPRATEDLNVVSAREGMVLIWAPNPEQDVAGYNIYRSTQSGTGFERVNQDLVYETTFTDSDVKPEQTYYYVVTAIDNAPVPNESKFSNEVSEVKRRP